MPEGPEIRRAADSLEAAIKGKPRHTSGLPFLNSNRLKRSWWDRR